MEIEVRSSPAITRVHTLHRIRTVVNHVEELIKAKAPEIDDTAIANHLISTHLSKPTTNNFRDQIGRRARDHLETARYLGLLYRLKTDRKYRHLTSFQGKALTSYKFEEECPKDYKEESVLIDKVCRFKITNTSYMQTPRGYEDFRSRICLNVLSALSLSKSNLSCFQIGYMLGEKKLDPFTHPKKLEKMVGFITSKAFENNYPLTSDDTKTIRRDTNPFLDWLAQLDLIRWEDEQIVKITDRGKRIAEYYAAMLPIWYCDLAKSPSVSAATLLLINFFKLTKDPDAIDSLLTLKTNWRLFKIRVNEAIEEALGKYFERVIKGNTLVDFTFYYDVPPEEFDEVRLSIQDLLSKMGYRKLNSDAVIRFLEMHSVKTLLPEFKSEADKLGEKLAEKQNIKIKVKSASIYGQFKSAYEATTYTLFKAIESDGFKIQKYQAQLEEFFAGNKRWERFAKHNPDLLLINDFVGLVECKSEGEWGDTLHLQKKVLDEITNYNLFCEAIKTLGLKRRALVLFSYEGHVRNQDIDEIQKLLQEEFPNVVILTNRALQKALVDVSFKNDLKEMIEKKRFKQNVIEV